MRLLGLSLGSFSHPGAGAVRIVSDTILRARLSIKAEITSPGNRNGIPNMQFFVNLAQPSAGTGDGGLLHSAIVVKKSGSAAKTARAADTAATSLMRRDITRASAASALRLFTEPTTALVSTVTSTEPVVTPESSAAFTKSGWVVRAGISDEDAGAKSNLVAVSVGRPVSAIDFFPTLVAPSGSLVYGSLRGVGVDSGSADARSRERVTTNTNPMCPYLWCKVGDVVTDAAAMVGDTTGSATDGARNFVKFGCRIPPAYSTATRLQLIDTRDSQIAGNAFPFQYLSVSTLFEVEPVAWPWKRTPLGSDTGLRVRGRNFPVKSGIACSLFFGTAASTAVICKNG